MKLAPYVYDSDFDTETVPRTPNVYYNKIYEKEPLLNPHGDRVLPLFIIGKKGVAELDGHSLEYMQLKEYIEDGQLDVFTWNDGYSDNRKIVYRPELKNDAQELLAHFLEIQTKVFSLEEMLQKHRRIGEILGYSSKSINYFCEKVKVRFNKR